MDALSHQGQTSGQVGQKWTREEVSDSDSGRQVQRYIRLTSLISELLTKVDEGRIAFNPAVELSYLSEEQQRQLLTAMEANQCTPSHAQAIQLKKAAQAGTLDAAAIQALMRQEKPNQQEQIKLKRGISAAFSRPATPMKRSAGTSSRVSSFSNASASAAATRDKSSYQQEVKKKKPSIRPLTSFPLT